jgi:signal peptide peptidase SppA
VTPIVASVGGGGCALAVGERTIRNSLPMGRRFTARITNAPLYATPSGAFALYEWHIEAFAPAVDPSGRGAAAPYTVANGGVAILPVRGELVNRSSLDDAAWGLTSYEGLRSALRMAERDHRVRSLVLDIDSPGGELAGATETAAIVSDVATTKPVVAYINSLAGSAAYAIAAAASEIIATPSATLGSIGVVWLHLDRSKMLSDAGFKPTLLHAGAFKTDGNSLEILGPNARARIQALLDGAYELLLTSIGKHRPALGAAGARATEAGLFMGQAAVGAGLADRVGDLSFALGRAKALAAALRPRNGPMLSVGVGGVDEKAAATLERVAPEAKPPHDLGASAPHPALAAFSALDEPPDEYEAGRLAAVQALTAAGRLPRPLAAARDNVNAGGDLGANALRPALAAFGAPPDEYEAGARSAAQTLAAAGRQPLPGPPRTTTQP